MAGAVKVRNKHTQPVILDADMLDDFQKAIGQDISGYFRQIQYDVVKAYREEQNKKKVKPRSNGAINYIYNESPIYLHRDKKQATLDIYAKVPDINKFLDHEKDINKLGQIRRNAHLIEAIAKTKIVRIGKGLA